MAPPPRDENENFRPMEMEVLNTPMQVGSSTARRSRSDPLDQLWMLIRLYIEYYPKISIVLGLAMLGGVLFVMGSSMRAPVTRNRLEHDYTAIGLNYNFKASQIDHWCLFGGDTDCLCDDFSEPISREEFKGWLAAHEANKQRITQNTKYDVVFLGDETTEGWNGRWMNMPIPRESKQILNYWNKTFTKEGGGNLEGLALGIAGDSAPNLLWRLQHGEAPMSLSTNVWWLLVGTNDLGRGGCSEEATVLGILRTAEELHYSHPDAVIVIQGILPRSNRPDGSLTQVPLRPGLFNGNNKAKTAERAKKKFLLYPSIISINKELEEFCAKHDHLVYFDASSFFLGRMSNSHFKGSTEHIVTDLMPDGKKLSFQGYKVMGDAVVGELERIFYEGNETNYIEPGNQP